MYVYVYIYIYRYEYQKDLGCAMCFMEFPCIYRRTSTSNIYICVYIYIYIYTLYMYIVKLPSFRVNMWHHLHFPESARGIIAASILQGWEGRGVKVASARGKLDRSEGLTFTLVAEPTPGSRINFWG